MVSFPPSMKRFRLLLLAVGALVLLLAVAIAVAFNSTFQTWAARKAIASNPDLRATIGEVSAGTREVALRNLKYELNGAVLTLPAVDAELPVLSAATSKKVLLSKLVAKGWVLDLSGTNAVQVSPLAVAPGADPAALVPPVAAQAFAGVFGQLQLPVDVAVDGLQLEGEVVLPEHRGRVKVSISGGGIGAGKEGKLDLVANATLADPKVNAVEVRAGLIAAMDTPRTFSRLAARLDSAASGAQFPQGVKLTADLAASRAVAGESYSLAVVSGPRELINLQTNLPRDGQRLAGLWKVDVRDTDVTPFALGRPMPAFVAVGEGKFDTDTALATLHASGRLKATASRLEILAPELAMLGELTVASDFDLAERGGTFVVQKLEADIATAQPVAIVRTLQAFEFNPKTRALQAADAAKELVAISVQGVPVAWAKPFLKDIALSGGQLRGDFVATARGGGTTIRSVSPITLDGLSVAQGGKRLIENVDVSLSLSADYAPQGWQAEVSALSLKSAGASVLSLDAKAGQLAGKGQPLKATGKLVASMPGVLKQPVAAGMLAVTAGEAAIEFAGSFETKQEIQAKVALRNLAALAEGKSVTLPTVSTDLRADIAADGKITFSAPLIIEKGERKSDLAVAGTFAKGKDQVRTIEAQLTGGQLVLNDAQILGAALPQKEPEPAKAGRDTAPPWTGIQGTVTLALKRVIYSDTFEVSDLTGRLRIDAGTVKLEGLQAGLGENGRANFDGSLTFNASNPQPYTLLADVAVKQFEVGSFFRAAAPDQPATVEGKFDLTSKLAARGEKLSELALAAGGEFQLTSRGGSFRGLPLEVGNLTENTGKIAGWLGSALSSMKSKKEAPDVANKAQAVSEFAKALNPIAYDQLSIVVSRDAALNTTVKDFTLISPELRLTGGGTLLHRPGGSLLDDSMAMEFRLRARGRQGDLLKYLGVLENQTDDLGYLGCTLPVKISGRPASPDVSELKTKLVTVALEKSGLTDKAAELVKQIFGK